MLVLEWKGRAFIEKVNSRCFCWFPAAILVDSFCPPVWRLHTKLYKGAWNISATNSETVGHKDLRFGQIVYILVFYNISFSWLFPPDSFQCIFLLRESENDLYYWLPMYLLLCFTDLLKDGMAVYRAQWTDWGDSGGEFDQNCPAIIWRPAGHQRWK